VVKVGETDLEPEVATLPILVIEQAVALVDDHVRVELCPDKMRLGLAEIEQVGAGVVTVTVAEAEQMPAIPAEQVRV